MVTVPNLVPTGETVSIPTGRTLVHPNLQVDGTLEIDGTLFIPSGGSVSTTEVDATVVKQNGSVVAIDDAVVHKTGNETKTGTMTFMDNVGIGVTPSTYWLSGAKILQFGASGSLTNNSANATMLVHNAIFGDSNSLYQISGQQASRYQQSNGVHAWYTATSGVAGNPITWTNAMTLASNGNLLVGTSTDNGADKLQVNGGIGTYGSQFNLWNNDTLFETVNRGSSPREFRWYVGASGSAPVASLTTSGVWTNASDKRNKVNIKDIHYGLDTIMSLSAKEYDLKSDGTHGIGFIAQEVKNIIPELVFGDEDNSYLTLDYASMVTVLTKAVQEQQAQIEELKLLIEGKQNGN